MNQKEAVDSTARKGFHGGLLPGRTYDTVVVAVYLNQSTEMYAGSHSTKAHAPSKVRDLRGKVSTSDSISLTWSPPLQPGGELREYQISLTYNKSRSILTKHQRISSKRTTYEASGLPVDCDIYVKVKARTKSHMADADPLEGSWSEVLHLKTFADPTHSNWTVDVVTVNESTLQFEWLPPLFEVDGMLRIELKAATTIDGREVTFKNVFSPTVRKGFLGGLFPGRTYDTLLVVEYSNRSTEMYIGRHSTKPPSSSAVRNFRTNVATPHSIGLMWDSPLQPDGYLAWYQLSVQYERTDGSNFEALRYISPEVTAYVIDQLPANREISVKIQSNTKLTVSQEEYPAGQWSETIRVKTLAEPLNRLSVDVVPVNNNSLHFNWTNWIFAKDGLLWFELKAIDTLGESPSHYSTYVISSKRTGVLGGLIFGRTYKTAIVAVYDNWRTEKYSGLHAIPSGASYEVHNMAVEAVNSSAIRLTWDPPFDPHADILNYFINLQFTGTGSNVSLQFPPGEYTHVIGELPADSEITVKARIISRSRMQSNENIAGKWSEVLRVKTYAVPDAPLIVMAKPISSTAIKISWRPPHNINRKIDHYRIFLSYSTYYGDYESRNITMEPLASNCVVDYLPPATDVEVKIAAVVRLDDQDGMAEKGRWSKKIAVTTPSFSNTPLNFTAKAINSTAIHVSWRPPNNTDRKIDHYKLFVWYHEIGVGHDNKDIIIEPSRNYFVVNDLPPATDILVTIAAVVRLEDEDGIADEGMWTRMIFVTTLTASYEVHNLAVEAVNSSAIRLTWDPPFDPHADILNYFINLQFTGTNDSRSNISLQFPPGEYTHVIGELPADSEITVRARIISRSRMQPNKNMAGKWSEVLRVKTYAVLSAPLNVTAEPISSNAIQISWRPLHNTDRKIDHYRIFLCYSGDDGDYESKNITMEPLTNNCVVSGLPPATDVEVKVAAVVRLEKEGVMTEEETWSEEIAVTTLSGTLRTQRNTWHPKRTPSPMSAFAKL
nr:unnamed protein product [Spirometra erinaceieuropaei]